MFEGVYVPKGFFFFSLHPLAHGLWCNANDRLLDMCNIKCHRVRKKGEEKAEHFHPCNRSPFSCPAAIAWCGWTGVKWEKKMTGQHLQRDFFFFFFLRRPGRGSFLRARESLTDEGTASHFCFFFFSWRMKTPLHQCLRWGGNDGLVGYHSLPLKQERNKTLYYIAHCLQ